MRTFLSAIFSLTLFGTSVSQLPDYRILEGKIDNYPVAMQLYEATNPDTGDSYYMGNYWYKTREIPIILSQQTSEDPQTLLMVNWEDGNKQELFSGTYTNGTYKGFWKKGSEKLPFELKVTQKEKYTDFQHYRAERVVPIKSGNPQDTIAGTYTYDYYLPSDLKLQKELVRQSEEDYEDFDSYVQMKLDEFETGYKSEIGEMLKESYDMPAFMYNYVYNDSFSPYLNTENYLVMEQGFYQYTGGAHGMSSQQFFTYDKRNRKWLEIGDILDLNKEEQINKALGKAVRKTYHIPDGVKLNESEEFPFLAEEIVYSPNFTLSRKGVTFHYALYEMTPYAYGYFSQFVAYEDLKPYLKKGFKY